MKRIYTATGLLIFDGLLLGITRLVPGAADFYQQWVYPVFLNTIGRLAGLFPWSMAELIIYTLMLICIFWTGRGIRRWVGKYPNCLEYWKNGIKNFILAAAVFLTLFSLTEGPNYYQSSFAEQTGMTEEEYSTEELVQVYQILTERVNALADKVGRDENGLMTVEKDAESQALAAMEKLAETYPQLAGYYPRPKQVLFSKFMSLMDITGIYTPFTVEANYNRDMVDYNKPFTMCHELSHLKGFMQEDEANFIAFLACEQADSVEFQYSGALLGLIYCGNELYARDQALYRSMAEQVSGQACADLQANNYYWDTYEGFVAQFSQKINDVYLRVNQQDEGITSYSRVVDLIVQHLL